MLKLSSLLVAIVAMAVVSGPVAAQRATDKYLISAQAGGVNFVSGQVQRLGASRGRLLKGDSIAVGDTIQTGENGRIEVLMNPGSFIRVGPNSEFAFESVSLDDLRVSFNRGSAIFEVYATDRFQVKITTPTGVVTAADSGVYRIDLDALGSGTLAVLKGKARVAGASAVVKDGREVQIGSNTIAAKFDKKAKNDDLSLWSHDRSKELAKVSSSLSASALNAALVNSFMSGGFGLWDSFGLWVFDRARAGYCFLPFGFGWRSPYGFGVGSGIDWWQLQRMTYSPMYPGRYTRTTNMPTATVSGNPPAGPTNGQVAAEPAAPIRQHPKTEPPPFADIQRQQRVDPNIVRGEDGFMNGRTNGGTRGIDGMTGAPSQIGPSASPTAAPMSLPTVAPSRGRGGKVSPIDD